MTDAGTLLITTIINLARERIGVTRIDLDTRGYLLAAHALGVDEGDMPPRAVPATTYGASWFAPATAHTHPSKTDLVRVGPKFQMRGPMGVVWIVESREDAGDASAVGSRTTNATKPENPTT